MSGAIFCLQVIPSHVHVHWGVWIMDAGGLDLGHAFDRDIELDEVSCGAGTSFARGSCIALDTGLDCVPDMGPGAACVSNTRPAKAGRASSCPNPCCSTLHFSIGYTRQIHGSERRKSGL